MLTAVAHSSRSIYGPLLGHRLEIQGKEINSCIHNSLIEYGWGTFLLIFIHRAANPHALNERQMSLFTHSHATLSHWNHGQFCRKLTDCFENIWDRLHSPLHWRLRNLKYRFLNGRSMQGRTGRWTILFFDFFYNITLYAVDACTQARTETHKLQAFWFSGFENCGSLSNRVSIPKDLLSWVG